MVFDGSLAASHDETELLEALVQLLEDRLHYRLQPKIPTLALGDDRQHLLRLLLGDRQEPRTQSSRSNRIAFFNTIESAAWRAHSL
jgi:hypothetical protein